MLDNQNQPRLTPQDGTISPTERMKWAGWIGGVVFIGLVVALALAVPNPTGFQEWAFRVPMSMGAAAFAAFVPGFLIVQAFTKKEDKQAGICGGGAIVVFVLLMYVNPTRLGIPAAQLLGTPVSKPSTETPATNGSLINLGPGATQMAGRDINNIQAGGNVTIGDPVNVAQIAKEFRQPVRRMVEITEGYWRFFLMTDNLLFQALDNGSREHFLKPKLKLGDHAHEEWKKLEDVKKAQALCAELKQLGGGFAGGSRIVSEIANAVAFDMNKRIHDLPFQFIFAPTESSKLYEEPTKSVGLSFVAKLNGPDIKSAWSEARYVDQQSAAGE